MRKYLLTLLLVLSLAFPVFGADTKITGLDADTTPTTDDLVTTVNDPGGTPANKKVTLGNFAKAIASLFAAPLLPTADNTYALGSATLMWSDLFLGDGSVVNFNNGDVTLTHSANTLTLGGGTLALGANNLTMTGSLGATGARLTAGFFTDLTVTNAIAGSVTGNAATATALAADPADCAAGQIATGIAASGALTCTATPSVTTLTGNVTGNVSGNAGTVTVADAAEDASTFPLLGTAATGSLAPATDAGLSYNATTNILTAGGFSGPLNGTVGATTPAAGSFTTVTVSPSASPTMTFSDSDDAAGTAAIYGNSSGGTNAIVMTLGVEIADGTENTPFMQLNGASTGTIALLKPVVSTGAIYPSSADGAALGSASAEWSDIFLADGAVINLGADQDVTLTHVADTGVLLNSSRQLQFGDSGTYINQSADGVLNIASDTELKLLINDEDLKFTKTGSNGITLGTNTGVTTITSALNLVTTGNISGKIPMITKSDNYTLGTDDAQEAYGYMVWMSGANKTLTLPAVAAGMSVCLYSTDAEIKRVDPNGSDGIRMGAARDTDGDAIACSAAIGAFVCLVADGADGWTVLGKSGTWAAE